MRSILIPFLLLHLPLFAQQWNWAADAGGGGNTDFCYGIATDSQGNAYWVGSASGTADFGCGTLTPGNTIAGVIAKYDANGVCQWVRGITTSFYDAWVYGIAIDAEDRIYITGSCQGTTNFGNGISLSGSGSSDDWFTARYDADGNCVWAKRITNSTTSSEGRSIALDHDGNLYVTGFAGGTSFTFEPIAVSTGSFQRQAVIVKYDSTGTALWAKSTTGTGVPKSARGITVAGDRLFITGQIGYAPAFYDNIQITPTNSLNLYVLACDLGGNGLWARSYGNGDHEGFSIAADTLGNVFVVGRLWGDLFLPDDTLSSASSNDDMLIMGLSQDGDYRWAQRAGSTQRDIGWDVIADGLGNAYVATHFQQSITFFGQSFSALGSEDALIAKIEADGDLVWAQRPSGFLRDIPLCIHRQEEAPHELYFGGYYFGPITYGGTTLTDMGNGDAMIVSGIDTTFDVSAWASTVCPGACNGEAVAFCNGEAPFTFLWNTGATTQDIEALCPGEYIVEVTDAIGEVRVDTVYVNEVADPGFTVQANGSTLSIIGGVAYEWYFNDEVILDSDTSSIEADANGDYHAMVTTLEGCVFSSDTLAYIGMGLRDASATEAMSLYPSPASDQISIRTARPVTRLWIVTALGEIVPMQYDGTSKIDVSTLAPGLFFLRAELNDGRVAGGTFVKD
ncbi:MAG: SBBP repeat-containing protein [Flavobacteriales bacterium]|nr:SBBP repeat-containing protein [Flavobacteriales bacterium]